MKTAEDTSQTSWYLDDAYYDHLLNLTQAWALPQRVRHRLVGGQREEAEALLLEEARLIDDQHLEQWLDLYTEQCCYWIPGSGSTGDPRHEVTLEFHDRRRLLDRVTRLQTGYAYSQIPPTRSRHLLTNIELWEDDNLGVLARANCLIYTLFRGQQRTLGGWIGYSLHHDGAELRVAVKQINLIDADLAQENNTFFL